MHSDAERFRRHGGARPQRAMDNEPVEQTLGAHLYKGAVPAGKTAWLILGGECGAASGDLIGMK